ncbi:hypothetical protein SAMN05216266_105155 [Amycolatopsis marina]|uniref:Uncharacterized protein n=1 Tax=Amycolatopsis marina TaxID=490629 RepID=A0A1I0YLD0_9PSEU|nr:hypothetical protein [Amycolatopsis marina]SFB13737.1 hypothetical protein SAMN05216266_105155 [Amycolatopsis marina]
MLPSPLVELCDVRLDEHEVRVYLKREDVIRGEEHLPLNESLAYAVDRGMTLT